MFNIVLKDSINDSAFFDALSRIQSNRLDDQRCSFRFLTQSMHSTKEFFSLFF
jgi:hypothetical protein